jgi:tRNA (Thr-GGU) A37 N-methylase
MAVNRKSPLKRRASIERIHYIPIGVVRSPHTDPAATPRQTESARGIPGRVELESRFAPGLKDLAEFDYLWLLVHFHAALEGRALWTQATDAADTPAGARPHAAGTAVRESGELPPADVTLEVVTVKGEPAHGVFATRAPYRPNPIGLSLVRLVSVDGATLHIEDLDLLDGTPVLDIKPYVPKLDNRETARIGWFARRLH